MADMFKIDTKDMKGLARMYKESPLMMRQISAQMLTLLARTTEDNIRVILKKDFTIRQAPIIKNNVKSWAARPVAISSQEARAGSVRRERFTGWIEQEYGDRTKATHMPTTAARIGGSKSRVVSQGNRLRRKNQVKNTGDYQHKGKAGRSNKSREASMLRQMLADNYKGMISLSGRGLKGYKQGVYKFDYRRKKQKKGGYKGPGPAPRALTRVQITGINGTRPHRTRWLTRSLALTYRSNVTQRAWTLATKTVLMRRLQRALK